jgi:hypothetical protein
MSFKKLVVGILLAFVGVMFIVYVTPEIESGIDTANITNGLVVALLNMAAWIIPVGGIVGCFYGVFKLFGGGARSE